MSLLFNDEMGLRVRRKGGEEGGGKGEKGKRGMGAAFMSGRLVLYLMSCTLDFGVCIYARQSTDRLTDRSTK